jgi:hypothetical protein
MAETIQRPSREERIFFAGVIRSRFRIEELDLQWPFTERDLRTAWKKVALRTHPDQGGSEEAFIRAKAAYEEALRLFVGATS